MSNPFVDGHVEIDSPATMLAVLEHLYGLDPAKYRGSIAPWPQGWLLEVNIAGRTEPAVVTVTDHLVLTYGVLVKLTDAEFQAGQ